VTLQVIYAVDASEGIKLRHLALITKQGERREMRPGRDAKQAQPRTVITMGFALTGKECHSVCDVLHVARKGRPIQRALIVDTGEGDAMLGKVLPPIVKILARPSHPTTARGGNQQRGVWLILWQMQVSFKRCAVCFVKGYRFEIHCDVLLSELRR